eukprot:3283738-Alexandrium_andersonii.AAC.1
MSASLVGSEMCIRDRPKAPARQPSRERSAERRPWRRQSRQPGTRQTEAVSYTHLTLPTICSV